MAEPFGAAALRQLQRQPDFDLAHPGHTCESRHPYETACTCEHLVSTASCSSIWLHFDPRCATVEGEASLELLADGKLLHTFAGPASAWPKQPLMVPSAAIALRFRASRAPTGRKVRARAGVGVTARATVRRH